MMKRSYPVENFRIVVVDALPLRRVGLAHTILNWTGKESFVFKVVEARSPQDLVDGPDLFDIALFSIGGDAAGTPETSSMIASLSERVRGAPVVVLSDRETVADVATALRAGARGYITSCIDPCLMLRTLRFVVGGGIVFPPQVLLDGWTGAASEDTPRDVVTASVAKNDSVEGSALTPRESGVLQQLRCGRSNKMIGLHLGLSEATVKVHVRTIMRKLGVSNRTQAALCARDLEGVSVAAPIATETLAIGVFTHLAGEFMPAA